MNKELVLTDQELKRVAALAKRRRAQEEQLLTTLRERTAGHADTVALCEAVDSVPGPGAALVLGDASARALEGILKAQRLGDVAAIWAKLGK